MHRSRLVQDAFGLHYIKKDAAHWISSRRPSKRAFRIAGEEANRGDHWKARVLCGPTYTVPPDGPLRVSDARWWDDFKKQVA